MKPVVICFSMLWLIGCKGQPSDAPNSSHEPPKSAVEQSLPLLRNDDGTASFKARVIGQEGGQFERATLWLAVGEHKIGLPLEFGKILCHQRRAGTLYPVRDGDQVEVYGIYGDGKISLCGSQDFFIKPIQSVEETSKEDKGT